MSNEEVIEVYSQDPNLKRLFDSKAGVWENITIREHVKERLKNTTAELFKSDKNRTVGIPRETACRILTENGHGYFYRKNIFLAHTIVGGSSKTSSIWSFFNAFLRIGSKQNPLIIISTDSQASIDDISMAKIQKPEEQKVLADYFSGRATLEEILRPIDESENLGLPQVLKRPEFGVIP